MIFFTYINRILLLSFIFSLCCPANAAIEPPCELYPIAIPLKSLDGIQTGESITLVNGSKPGQFGWLNWGGYRGKGFKELAESFEPPGDSHTYRNPNNYRDSTVSVGDWVASAYKIKEVYYFNQALDKLRNKPIVLPIWDDKDSKAYNAYRVAGFATFSITDFSLPEKNSRYSRQLEREQSLTLTFLSYTQCDGSVNDNQAPLADDQTVDVDENTPLDLILTGSDPDGDELVYVIESLPAGGTLEVDGTKVTDVPFMLPENKVTFVPSVDSQ